MGSNCQSASLTGRIAGRDHFHSPDAKKEDMKEVLLSFAITHAFGVSGADKRWPRGERVNWIALGILSSDSHLDQDAADNRGL